jgi:hypothetical protein
MTEADSRIDRRIDAAIVRAIEESQFKKLTVLEIRDEVHFTRGITIHLEEMRVRSLVTFLTPGALGMETEVALACG